MSGLVCHRCSGDLSQGTAAEAARAAVAEVEADAEEARCLAEGNVAAVNGRQAAHSVVAGHPVVGGSAEAVAAGLGLEETKEAEDMIDRLAEAQSTAVGLAGLVRISIVLRHCQRKGGAPYAPFSGGAGVC